MTLRMLVDAIHPEETRVVIADDNNVLDFDIESSTKRQVKGNVYLAKVTRVEPSLQAAFVEYGGGRQGFLPFSEIHPDYYQIPVADRQELLAAQAEEHAAAEKAADAELEKFEAQGGDDNADHQRFEQVYEPEIQSEPDMPSENAAQPAEFSENAEEAKIIEVIEEKIMEDVGGDDPLEQRPRRSAIRRYKIQEVIKKNQVMLIQVIKEERGNKGASVTTYISLPGRYCVLMPNTAHGGGVSRKINDAKERRKLKELLDGLDLNAGMSLIIRTAGMGHTKADIARDYSYLIRLWNKIRELTLSSSAPSLVYEEGNVIKRSIRDFFNNDVDQVIVAGSQAMETASEFVKMLLPTHVDKLVQHDDILPIFQKYGVERQLSSMYDSTVVMRSGGYLVINPTEALISIDINSGRATGERNVEDTATRINIEAAHEIARQLRLRDLAGLIVIDFIDMMDSRHRRSVERALKDALKADRAKIQVGRISPFGLLEMSRQRLRPSLNEIQMIECPTCKGAGHVRSNDTAMLHMMRNIESEIALADYDGFRPVKIYVTTSTELAVHFLNYKRRRITELEDQYNFELVMLTEHLPMGQFRIQLEDAEGGRTRLMSSEDRESPLPQSRDRSKSRRDRKPRPDRGDRPERSGDRPERGPRPEREGNRDNNNNNNRSRNDNRPPRQERENNAPENAPEFTENGEATENAQQGEPRENRDGNRRDNNRRGGRGRDRRGRGRGNFENRNEAGAAPQDGSQPQEVTPGEPVRQYQSQPQQQPQPRAEVFEMERKTPAAEYNSSNDAAEDGNKPRKGGWWKKIIE